jgi:lysozyme
MLNWKKENDLWFCYKDGQKLISQWVQDENKKWYYLEKDGRLMTSWFQTAKNGDTWYFSFDKQTINEGKTFYTGEIVTGWLNYKEKWYFLEDTNEDTLGSMYCNGTYTINGQSRTFDKDGVWIENTSSDYILSSQGADFIGSWEGFWSQAQYDPYYPNDKRYITIGYGTTYEAMPSAFDSDNPLNTTCTTLDARQWLQGEAQTCAETIKAKLDANNITLSVNAMDALISFSYNCGTGALFNSTLWKNIINEVTDRDTISANFCAYSKANGVTSAGLLKRRRSEVSLYFDANYIGNN